MFDPSPSKVMYCYGIWTTLYDQIEKELPFVEFHEGVPNMEDIRAFTNGSHCLVILDDLMAEVSKSTQVQQLFTLGSHHLNVSICYLLQNLYMSGKSSRTISLNTHITILMKNPRGKSQISTLAQQTGLGRVLVEAFTDATVKKYGYLLVDLSPHTEEELRLVTSIFPDEDIVVYIPK